MTRSEPVHWERPAVSLFSNCGAGDYGYRKAGFNFAVMAELVAKRLRVAALNHPSAATVVGDLRQTWPQVVESYKNTVGDCEPWLLCACPPCQGMSSANNRRGRGDDIEAGGRDSRNLLVLPIVEVASRLKPRAIVVENVPAFLTRKVPHPDSGEGVSAASLLVERLAAEYLVFPFLSDLADYGVPQRRRRAFLTFVRRTEAGLDELLGQRRAPYPRPTHDPWEGGEQPVSIENCLKGLGLPPLDASSIDRARGDNWLHTVPVWSPHHYAMVEAIPAGSGGSAWENDRCQSCGEVEVGESDACCPKCGTALLRPVVRDEDGGIRLVRGFRASSYRRMDPNRPAPAVTTANGTIGSATTIHPVENRVLSVLECCALQTIPKEFRWTEGQCQDGAPHVVRRMVGEAVPPRFTQMHGHAVLGVLESRLRVAPISVFDRRCERASRRLDTQTVGQQPNKSY